MIRDTESTDKEEGDTGTVKMGGRQSDTQAGLVL